MAAPTVAPVAKGAKPAWLPSAAALTNRETDVLRLIAGGQSNREIAAELVLSIRTVERHITTLYGKIDARGRADATARRQSGRRAPPEPTAAQRLIPAEQSSL